MLLQVRSSSRLLSFDRLRYGTLCEAGWLGRMSSGQLQQRGRQFRQIRDADPCNHIISIACAKGAVAAGSDIAEGRSAVQLIKMAVEERKRGFAGLGSRLIEQRAEAGPNGCTPTGAADALLDSMEYDHRSLIGIGRQADIRHEALTSGIHAIAGLPFGALEEGTDPAAAIDPSGF